MRLNTIFFATGGLFLASTAQAFPNFVYGKTCQREPFDSEDRVHLKKALSDSETYVKIAANALFAFNAHFTAKDNPAESVEYLFRTLLDSYGTVRVTCAGAEEEECKGRPAVRAINRGSDTLLLCEQFFTEEFPDKPSTARYCLDSSGHVRGADSAERAGNRALMILAGLTQTSQAWGDLPKWKLPKHGEAAGSFRFTAGRSKKLRSDRPTVLELTDKEREDIKKGTASPNDRTTLHNTDSYIYFAESMYFNYHCDT